MAAEDRFSQSVISTLAKRAANICSNPDCQAITSGPAVDPSSSTNVGEAAHIFGASKGSARFDDQMTSAERSAITNAIWLCCTCHKLIDDDPAKYTADMLFEWQRTHERKIEQKIGKAARARERYENLLLERLGPLSYIAERILLEKPDHWEYRLTAELLRFELKPVLSRWESLKQGLYTKPHVSITRSEFMFWANTKIDEAAGIAQSLERITNIEFKKAWGDPGFPGDEEKIVGVCRFYGDVCRGALAWEESVRFTTVDRIFSNAISLLRGIGGIIIDEAAGLPVFMASVFSGEKPSGVHTFKIDLALPPGLSEQLVSELSRVSKLIS